MYGFSYLQMGPTLRLPVPMKLISHCIKHLFYVYEICKLDLKSKWHFYEMTFDSRLVRCKIVNHDGQLRMRM